MKRNHKMWRSVIALVLTFTLVFGTAGTAFAQAGGTGSSEGSTADVINYVSLGDSMTNGYGLDGYDGNTGVEDYGTGSYANLFAKWLGAENHAQLAMSAMRAEDLHWLLEVDYDDPEVKAVIEKLEADKEAKKEWDEDLWYSVFTNGDYWTWDELVNDYRFDVAAYCIQGKDGGDEFNDKATYEEYTDYEALCIVAEYYQNAVKKADVTSLGIGNGNFGVFAFGRIMNALQILPDTEDDSFMYSVDRAIAECDEETKAKIKELEAELYATAKEFLAKSDINLKETANVDSLLNAAVYTGLSFALNYAGSVEAILQLNPDAEIILVALMNTFASPADATTEEATIGDLLNVLFVPLNAYIAALPTYMQATKNSVYDEAKFYYAEADEVECMVETYGSDFKNPDGSINTKSTIRDRFVEDIVGTASEPGMVWSIMGGMELVEGITLTPVTLDEICAYYGMNYEQKAAYAAAETQKAVSIAVYLAFEDAIINGSKDASVTLNSVLSLELGADLFSGVMEAFNENIGTNGANYTEPATAAAFKIAAATVSKELANNNLQIDITAEQIASTDYAVTAKSIIMGLKTLDSETYDFAYENNVDGLKTMADKLAGALQAGHEGAIANADMLCMLLALPETLSAAVQADTSLEGLLGLFARCLIGNGLGGHPSATGHNQLFEAVKNAYETDYTAADKTIDNLIYVVTEYYDEAYAYAYKYADENGYIDIAVGGIDDAIKAVEDVQKFLAESSAEELGVTEDFFKDLVAQANHITKTLEKAKALILEADVLDQASLDALLALLTEAGQDMWLLYNTLEQAAIDVNQYVIIPALKEAHDILVNEILPEVQKQLQIAVEKGTAWLMEKAQEAYDAFVEWLLETALPETDKALYDWLYNNPDKVIAFFMEYGDEMGDFVYENYEAIGAVLGYVAYTFGPEVLEYVLENPEEALTNLVKWYEKYGHRVWPMIDRYIEELDKMGAFDELKESPEKMMALLNELFGMLEEYGDEMMQYVYDNAEEIAKELLKMLGELEAEAKAAVESFINEAWKQIEALEAQLDALYEALEKAHGELKAQIEKEIAKIEKQIEALKAQIEYIEGKLAELYDAIKDAEAAVKDLIEAIEEGSTAAIKEALSAIKDAMNKVNEAIDFVEDLVREINAAIDKAIEIIEKIEKAYKDTLELLAKIDADIKDLIEDIEAAVEKVEKAIEEFKAAAEKAAADIEEFVAKVVAAVEEMYINATVGYYTATDDSYYLALGDTGVEYAQIVADELDLDKDQFANEGLDGMRAEDLRMILDADYKADAYGEREFGDVAAELREALTAEIEKADLITLGFSNNTITEFTAKQITDKAEMDWTRYVGKDGAAAMTEAIAAIKEMLAENGVPAETAEMVLTAVESYAYAYTGFACNYPEAVNLIKAINPEAQVVVVGMYNPFENAVIEAEGVQIPVGEFVGALVDLANVHYTGYAMLTGNAVYVDAPAVEIKAPFEGAVGIEAFAAALVDMDSLEPSDAGNEYIAEQILKTMNVVDKDTYTVLSGIEKIKEFGDVTRENLKDAKALAESVRAAWERLTDAQRDALGLEVLETLLKFEIKIAEVELGIAEDIDKAETDLDKLEKQLADIERALIITETNVTNVKAQVINKSQVKVTWKKAATDPDKYLVQVYQNGKKVWTRNVAANKNTTTFKNLYRGANYTVRVTPVVTYDDVLYKGHYRVSNKVTAKLQKANLVINKSGKARIVKSADQNSTGFQIYISKDKKFKKNVTKIKVVTNKAGLNKTVKANKFKKGKNYIKVRAYTTRNGKTVYGAWSTVKTVTK